MCGDGCSGCPACRTDESSDLHCDRPSDLINRVDTEFKRMRKAIELSGEIIATIDVNYDKGYLPDEIKPILDGWKKRLKDIRGYPSDSAAAGPPQRELK